MPERPSIQSLLNHRFSRRGVLSGSIHGASALAAAYTADKVEKLITPKHEEFGYIEKIDEETRLALLQFRPVTVAHNGANDFGRLSMSISAGVDYVEADVREFLGRQIISHNEDSLGFAWNEGRRLFGFSGTIPYLKELVQEIKPNGQKLFLEIKEDSERMTGMVLNEVNRHGLETRVSYFARNRRTLDRIYQETERGNNLFYTVGDYEELEIFLDQQGQYKRQGVSLNVDLAQAANVSRIHQTGARVLVAVVGDSKQALEVLPYGIYGIISDNLSLLSVWRGNTPQRFWV